MSSLFNNSPSRFFRVTTVVNLMLNIIVLGVGEKSETTVFSAAFQSV